MAIIHSADAVVLVIVLVLKEEAGLLGSIPLHEKMAKEDNRIISWQSEHAYNAQAQEKIY